TYTSIEALYKAQIYEEDRTNNSNALQPIDNKSFHCSSFFELIASRPVDVIPCSERRIQAIGLGKGGRIDEHAVAIARNFGTGVMEYPNPGVRIVSFGVQGVFGRTACMLDVTVWRKFRLGF